MLPLMCIFLMMPKVFCLLSFLPTNESSSLESPSIVLILMILIILVLCVVVPGSTLSLVIPTIALGSLIIPIVPLSLLMISIASFILVWYVLYN